MKQESKKIGRLSNKTNIELLCPIWKSQEAIKQELRDKESRGARDEVCPQVRSLESGGEDADSVIFLFMGACMPFLTCQQAGGVTQPYCSLALCDCLTTSEHFPSLICNYNFRLEQQQKINCMKIGRHKHPCQNFQGARNKEGKGYFWFSTIVKLILPLLKKNYIK